MTLREEYLAITASLRPQDDMDRMREKVLQTLSVKNLGLWKVIPRYVSRLERSIYPAQPRQQMAETLKKQLIVPSVQEDREHESRHQYYVRR